MAKIVTESLVITLSKLVPSSTENVPSMVSEVKDELASIVQEMVGDNIIVEVDTLAAE